MKPNTKRKWMYVAAGLSALLLAPLGAALARPAECIKDTTKCDKDLLCTFKVELAEKILLYETFVANSPATKQAPKSTSQGVKYKGALYTAALAEATAANPKASAEDLATAAYALFVDKVRAKLAAEAAQYKDCKSLGVTPNDTQRGTWTGMHTDKSDCNVYGEIGTGKDRETLSLDDMKDKTDGCLEIYQSDRGHESVHQDFCYKRKGKQIPESTGLQGYVDEDIAAYRYSVQHAAGDLQRLQVLCSADPTTDDFRKRADDLLKKALQYQQNQAGTP
jgi:hypothetical protein